MRLVLSCLLLVVACAPAPMALPSEVEAAVDRDAEPALYRKLYDYAFLPQVQYSEQRVRLALWLRHMDFQRHQLGLLSELAARTTREREEVERVAAGIAEEHEPAIGAVYDQLWEGMKANASEDELARIGQGLDTVRTRESDLLDLRARSVRALMEAQQPFLKTLTPRQEALFADATFLLRHRLDPYANPGDFRALIGTIYYAGDFGMLTKPTFDPNEDHLNIGGLWSEEPQELAGPHFPDARREVVLYMVLLEPALPEAIGLASQLRAAAPDPVVPADPAPVPPVEPPPGAQAPPAPVTPPDPPPGDPGTPPPG